MRKLSANGLKWLNGIHLLAVACWIGGGVALCLLYLLKVGVDDGGVLFGINRSIHFVDMAVIVIPGAFGCLLTGLVYGMFTRWGFFRHGWMIFKWVLTIAAILFGTFYLGPWEVNMMDLSGELGMRALNDQAYLNYQSLHEVFGIVQVAALIIAVFVSIFKPWKNLGKKS